MIQTLLMQNALEWELEQTRKRAVEALEQEDLEVPDCMRGSLLVGVAENEGEKQYLIPP